jgi:membrane complex biogenesis BtpA family protein
MNNKLPKIIAALHLPPFPGSNHPDRRSLAEIRDYTLRNVEVAVRAGVTGLYLQDLGDHPIAPLVPTHVVAGVTAIGMAVRTAFPDLALGVCLMSHGAREPLAVAQAIGAQFVRIKVYVGVMIKAEGMLQGCAHEAIQYRAQLGAEDIAILADVHDRSGSPLGQLPLAEEARWAATFGRADGLILTGLSFAETISMVSEARQARLDVPLLIGGGVNDKNIGQALQAADGVIVSTAFKTVGGWTRESLQADWDPGRVRDFVTAAAL